MKFIVVGQNGVIGKIIKENSVDFNCSFVSYRDDFQVLDPLIQSPYQVIYLSWTNRVQNIHSDLDQYRNIVRAEKLFTFFHECKNFIRLINIGSYNEYGKINGDLDEKTVCFPSNAYSKAKFLVNTIGHRILGNKFLNIRLSNLISKYQPRDSLFISLFDSKINKIEKSFYNGTNIRTLITEYEFWYYLRQIMLDFRFGIINMSGGHLLRDIKFIELCISALNIDKNLIKITDQYQDSPIHAEHNLNINLLESCFGKYNKPLKSQIKILFDEYKLLESYE